VTAKQRQRYTGRRRRHKLRINQESSSHSGPDKRQGIQKGTSVKMKRKQRSWEMRISFEEEEELEGDWMT
jgi:hypothetical protein